jgi:hypothetical protein
MIFNRKKNPIGQGLLEATIAIGMILLGLGALLTLTLQNVSATTASSQRITALHLAREAIEVVRGIRDSNWLEINNPAVGETPSWDDGLVDTGCVSDCGGAYIIFYPEEEDPNSLFTVEFADSRDISNDLFRLYKDKQYHHWNQMPIPDDVNYGDTGFRRLIKIDPVCKDKNTQVINVPEGEADCSDEEDKIGLRVLVETSWPTSGIFAGVTRRSLTLTEYMYNWR